MLTEPAPPPRWVLVAGSWWLLAAVVLAVFLLSPVRDATDNDPAFVPLSAHSLVHDRDLALDEFGAERLVGHPVVVTDGSLDPGFTVAAVDGPGWEQLRAAVADPDVDVLDYFPWTGAVVAVPAVLAVDGWAAVAGTSDSGWLLARDDFALPHTAMASLVALGAVLAFRAAASVVLGGPDGRRRLLANASALVFALGTSVWSTASRALWQHTPSLLLLTLALWCAVRIDRDHGRAETSTAGPDPWVVGLAAAAAAAAVARPTNLVFAVVIAVWVLHRCRDRPVATVGSALLGGLVVVSGFLGFSAMSAGRAIPAYYSAGRLQAGSWFVEAVAANWVSPSRGLLVASPVLVLAVPGTVAAWRSARSERAVVPGRPLVLALWASVVGVTASVSAFPQWWAGHAFGPRFMTEALPQLALLAVPAVGRLFAADRPEPVQRSRNVAAVVAVVALSLWSVAFHAIGSIAGASGCWNAFPVDVDRDPSRVWSVTDAQVFEPVHRVLDPDRRAAQDAVCVGR